MILLSLPRELGSREVHGISFQKKASFTGYSIGRTDAHRHIIEDHLIERTTVVTGRSFHNDSHRASN
jgi:hypothetical protein